MKVGTLTGLNSGGNINVHTLEGILVVIDSERILFHCEYDLLNLRN